MIDGGRPSSLHLGVAAVSANVVSRRLPRIVVRGNNIIKIPVLSSSTDTIDHNEGG